MPDPLVVTPYAALSHKATQRDAARGSGAALGPSWVPEHDRERLAAYLIRSAYQTNVARLALPPDVTDEVRNDLREYGDPAMLVDRVQAGVMGADWAVVVDGADEDPTEGPSLPPRPEPTPPLDDEVAQAAVAALDEERLEQWRADVIEAVDAWRDGRATQALLRTREAAVRAWADDVHLAARLHEGERHAIGLGDAVYVLWHRPGGWPEVQAMEPDSYFPVMPDDGTAVEFPDKVHFAWEFEVTDDAGAVTRYLRRLTFELVDLQEIRAGFDDLGRPAWLDEDGQPSLVPVDRPDERVGPDGVVRRRYPWDPKGLPEAEWSDTVCLYSDGTWDLSKTSISGLADLSESAATWTAYRADVGVDFLPVVHIPNTPAGAEHFGTPVLDRVAQVFDDLARNDSDIMKAGRFIGEPTIAMSGTELGTESVLAPGRIFGLQAGGTMETLDLSSGIEKLSDAGDRLQARLWQVAGVPAEIIGRAESGDVAGVTLALRFAPFAQLVGVLRMTRDPKYRLMFRFAQRMAQVQQALEPGETPETRLRWGSFMPTDQAATVKTVAEAVRAHAMSTQTAVTMLVAAGLPVADARAEVERIHAENTAAAVELVAALGDAGVAIPDRVRLLGDVLGETIGVGQDAAPTVVLPPVGSTSAAGDAA